MLYRLSGVPVESEIHLPSPEDSSARPEADLVTFRLGGEDWASAISDGAWQHREHGVSVGVGEHGFVVLIPDCAEFWIGRDGSEVAGRALSAYGPELLAQLFVDQVLPLVLHLRGRYALHASSVVMRGRALVAFVGLAGSGKSTLASSFARNSEHILFSDDCLALEPVGEEIVAHPSYPSARLWSESAAALFPERAPLPLASVRTGKLRAWLEAVRVASPLRAIYVLQTTDRTPEVTRLSRRDALVALTPHVYRLDPGNRERLVEELATLFRVVTLVPVRRLQFPHDYAMLPAVREAILADLGRST